LVIMITIMMILMAEVCPSEVSEGKLEVEVEGQLGWEGIQGHKEQGRGQGQLWLSKPRWRWRLFAGL